MAASVRVSMYVNTDSVVERRALRETVFPKLREHCRNTHGLDLMVRLPLDKNVISPDWLIIKCGGGLL